MGISNGLPTLTFMRSIIVVWHAGSMMVGS